MVRHLVRHIVIVRHIVYQNRRNQATVVRSNPPKPSLQLILIQVEIFLIPGEILYLVEWATAPLLKFVLSEREFERRRDRRPIVSVWPGLGARKAAGLCRSSGGTGLAPPGPDPARAR